MKTCLILATVLMASAAVAQPPGMGEGHDMAARPLMAGELPVGPVTVGESITFAPPAVTAEGAANCTPGTTADALRLVWSLASRPLGGTAPIDANTGVLVPDAAGTYVIECQVIDPAGYAAATTTSISVGPCTAAPHVAISAPLLPSSRASAAPC